MIPPILYGTAWKEHRTEELTALALDAGFVGIDTANQRKHYVEAGVGAAVAAAIASGKATREGLFLQTKFTYRRGQDHRLPYDPDALPAQQVDQSFASSLEHLGTETIDSYVLHGPHAARGWSDTDREVWRAMEAKHDAGLATHLGVSNIGLDQLEALCADCRVAPRFVQNRCYARTGWDRAVRRFCRDNDIVYQGFSLLTANTRELSHPSVRVIAERTGWTVPQIVFAFARQIGMQPLTGTTDAGHMAQDLESLGFSLDDEDIAAIEAIGG